MREETIFRQPFVRLLVGLGVPAAAAAGAGILYRGGSPLFCWFYRLTGLYCPGCGSGRALTALVRGDLLSAPRYNLVFCLVLPGLVYYFAGAYIRIVFQRDPLPLPRLSLADYHKVMFFMIAYWIVRNLPWFPFCLLAPVS